MRIVSQLSPSAGGAAGAVWQTYGIYTYRRPTPADLLVPSLPHTEYVVGQPSGG